MLQLPKPTKGRSLDTPENVSMLLQNRLLAVLLKNSTDTVTHLKTKLHSFLTRDPPLLSGPYHSQLSTITSALTALEVLLTQTMQELEKERTTLRFPFTVDKQGNSASATPPRSDLSH